MKNVPTVSGTAWSVPDAETWRRAVWLIEEQGMGAFDYAIEEAERCLGAEDMAAGSNWLRVAQAIDTFLCIPENATLH